MLLAAAVSWTGEAGNSQMSTSAITVHLELLRSSDQNVLARLEFENRASTPVALLSWLTYPTGDIDGNYFEVSVNGEKARYTGILIKRSPPVESDYLRLRPGETLSKTVNLSSGYAIDCAGVVRARYRAVNRQLVPDAGEGQLESNEAVLETGSGHATRR
jgi:peptidyl-Lys metalloendopeptidase